MTTVAQGMVLYKICQDESYTTPEIRDAVTSLYKEYMDSQKKQNRLDGVSQSIEEGFPYPIVRAFYTDKLSNYLKNMEEYVTSLELHVEYLAKKAGTEFEYSPVSFNGRRALHGLPAEDRVALKEKISKTLSDAREHLRQFIKDLRT